MKSVLRSSALAALVLMLSGSTVHAEVGGAEAREAGAIREVKAVYGLPGIAANADGVLSFSLRTMRFTTDQGSYEIERQRIVGVSDGDERVESFGTKGRVVRMLIPYGGGFAVAAVAHKKVGLLTIEFTDAAGDYHGAVFVLNTDDMGTALGQLDVHPPSLYAPALAPVACPASKVRADTVRVEEIGAELQSDFPAEDRVLLYEHLVERLKSEKSIEAVYRAGGTRTAGECAEFTVTVRAEAFKKGDQAVRASLGPLGHFVGTTKLNYHLTVRTQDGTAIVDQEMKKSEGSDSDSLNVTKAISKAVVKSLKKSRKELRKTQMA
ncbi:hypothetical protein [Granulicella tundricola]|nr:hypothetical protein [Granulicella tundricola]